MTGLGPHALFIIGSYVAAIVIIGGLTGAIIAGHRARARALARLDRR